MLHGISRVPTGLRSLSTARVIDHRKVYAAPAPAAAAPGNGMDVTE